MLFGRDVVFGFGVGLTVVAGLDVAGLDEAGFDVAGLDVDGLGLSFPP